MILLLPAAEHREALLLALADARRAEEFLAREGYRRCDVAECNCGEWHGGHATRRLREVMEERGAELEATIAVLRGGGR